MFKSYLKLVRWPNLLMLIATLLLMHFCVATPIAHNLIGTSALTWWQLTLLVLATVCIAAGGYAVNDYFDMKIDAINRPKTRIVGRLLDRKQAVRVYQYCSIAGAFLGLILAVALRSWSLGIIFVFMPGLMWFYSAAYKRQFIIGNLIVALSTALSVLLVAIANAAALHAEYDECFDLFSRLYQVETTTYIFVGCFAAMAFLLTLIREIIKDAQDEEGDREMECRTIPIRMGIRGAKVVLYMLIIVTIVLVYLFAKSIPATNIDITSGYLIIMVIIPLGILMGAIYGANCPTQWKQASLLAKSIMAVGTLYAVAFAFQISSPAADAEPSTPHVSIDPNSIQRISTDTATEESPEEESAPQINIQMMDN